MHNHTHPIGIIAKRSISILTVICFLLFNAVAKSTPPENKHISLSEVLNEDYLRYSYLLGNELKLNPNPYTVHYNALPYHLLPDDELHRNTQSESDHIAINCKWVETNIPRQNDKISHDTHCKIQMANFLGFTEARLRSTPPKWFNNILTNKIKSYQNNDLDDSKKYIMCEFSTNIYYNQDQHEERMPVPCGNIVKKWSYVQGNNNEYIVDLVDGYTININIPMPHDLQYAADTLHVSELANHYLIMLSSAWGISHPIYCVDKSSMELSWESWSWSSGYSGAGGGAPPFTLAQAVQQDSNVIVFGVSLHLPYIERYDLNTGKCDLRLSPYAEMPAIGLDK
ncbi:hypothetical protein [Rubinisphaera italica]|uniref:Uncharacterized protein n=1 Tax=Rubinisphaera italica TaxID=2527969 RepID=A0A5C5XIV5_9PLAN|nr:hypothetical protein [Rubinisphaera italica]TWT63116.1 hypothetical protein Pan54_38670 [Rubinisphaera italica]